MYTNKKRQRNFKRIREIPKIAAATTSNPSKRHRERLNNELESVASLLPYDASVIARLDKLSVLRLAVSFLRSKTLFQALFQRCCSHNPPFSYFVNSATENEDDTLKALGAFLLILSPDGEIVYSTPNVETYLGFHQSDILHQPIYDMVHSEDRDELRRLLFWNFPYRDAQSMLMYDTHSLAVSERQASARFRCFLDNTCGFLRIDIQGRVLVLDSCLPQCYLSSRPEPSLPLIVLSALCVPYILPSYAEAPSEEHFLRSKHALDMSVVSLDSKMMHLLECQENQLPQSIYTFIHPNDAVLVGEAHRQVVEHGVSGILVYRMISRISNQVYWFQSSCRLQSKNGKPDVINCSHRILTECEGVVLLEKRNLIAPKSMTPDDVAAAAVWSSSFHLRNLAPQNPPPLPAQTQHASCNVVAAKNQKEKLAAKKNNKTSSNGSNKSSSKRASANAVPAAYVNYSTPVPCVQYYPESAHAAALMMKANSRGYLDYGAGQREESQLLKPYFPHDQWSLASQSSAPAVAWNYVQVPSKSFSISEVTNTLLGP